MCVCLCVCVCVCVCVIHATQNTCQSKLFHSKSLFFLELFKNLISQDGSFYEIESNSSWLLFHSLVLGFMLMHGTRRQKNEIA